MPSSAFSERAVTTDDTILLTGLHGEEIPARVTFEAFDEDGLPSRGELQARDLAGNYHTVKQLVARELAPYWQEFTTWAAVAAAEDAASYWSAA
ncbi:hypothetical protein ACL598_16980 [Bordetella bronchialis]|uniref:hypothetical protein n=1 Tax=Bordetella bronchialis TaxID=463025 RepID=UPI003D057C02